MAVSMYDRNLLMIHNSFATVEWKVEDFSSNILSDPSVTSNNLLVAGDVTPLDTYDTNFLIASFI